MPNADHAPLTHVMPVHVNPASGAAPDPNAAVAEVVFVDDSGNPTDAPGGGSAEVADGSITTAKLADGAVTAAKIASGVIPTAYVLPAASSAALGGVKQGSAIADLSAAPTQTDFNNLLAVLRVTGLIASA